MCRCCLCLLHPCPSSWLGLHKKLTPISHISIKCGTHMVTSQIALLSLHFSISPLSLSLPRSLLCSSPLLRTPESSLFMQNIFPFPLQTWCHLTLRLEDVPGIYTQTCTQEPVENLRKELLWELFLKEHSELFRGKIPSTTLPNSVMKTNYNASFAEFRML